MPHQGSHRVRKGRACAPGPPVPPAPTEPSARRPSQRRRTRSPGRPALRLQPPATKGRAGRGPRGVRVGVGGSAQGRVPGPSPPPRVLVVGWPPPRGPGPRVGAASNRTRRVGSTVGYTAPAGPYRRQIYRSRGRISLGLSAVAGAGGRGGAKSEGEAARGRSERRRAWRRAREWSMLVGRDPGPAPSTSPDPGPKGPTGPRSRRREPRAHRAGA